MDVSHAQAAKLMQRALALRGVYQKLLEGAPKREAFEDTAKVLNVAPITVERWEREFRQKGHIEVHAMDIVFLCVCSSACVCRRGCSVFFCVCFRSFIYC